MKFQNIGRVNGARLFGAMLFVVGWMIMLKVPWFMKGHHWIYASEGIVFTMVAIILIDSYRNPQNRASFIAVVKDRMAMTVGGAWMIFVLVRGFISGGLHTRTITNVIPALIGGFAVATVVNWFSKRRGNSKEG